MEWICAKDRMPSKNGEYLCVCEYWVPKIEVCSFSKNLYSVDKFVFSDKKKKCGFYNYDRDWGYFEEMHVTHWMELPDLPSDA